MANNYEVSITELTKNVSDEVVKGALVKKFNAKIISFKRGSDETANAAIFSDVLGSGQTHMIRLKWSEF